MKKYTATFLLTFCTIAIALAQVPADTTPTPEQPSWIPNPIGSVIGLVLLLGMCWFVARTALAKE